VPVRSIKKSRAIVTGASSGIGRAIALELARQGADLIVTARRDDRLRELMREIAALGRRALSVAGDITHADVRRRITDDAAREFGGIDILVNNAGIGALGPFADADEARLRRVMEVNFFAPAELTRAALPLLRQAQRPIVVNIGSVLGHVAVPEKSEYCASKFALHGWNDALRAELSADGIDVLLVSPSTTASEFFDRVIAKPAGEAVPVNRFQLTPEAVARRVVKAIRRGRREIILPLSGRMLVWCDRLAPGLVSWFLRKKQP
jgi:short-subunit dehydrogenase